MTASTFDVDTVLKNLPNSPGIYKMLDAHHKVIYIGKAKNLKKRVSSYFYRNQTSKLKALVSNIADIDLIVTANEHEALLLESNLIKKLHPRFNVLFRDDKSYPYIYLSAHEDFPRMDFHRGAKGEKGYYFGPYPSAHAVRESLNLLQKMFMIRQCTDSFFKNRSRPCIQYQIKRCTAPCVGYIDSTTYLGNVKLAKLFLEGNNQQLLSTILKKMEAASTEMAYELAAKYRDTLTILRSILEKQVVITDKGDVDIIAIAVEAEQCCIEILFVRNGRMIGNHAYFPQIPGETTSEDILTDFIPQFYLNSLHQRDIPKGILLNLKLSDANWFSRSLQIEAKHPVKVRFPIKEEEKRLVDMAYQNARTKLASHLMGKIGFMRRFEALQSALQLDNLPRQIECFDISHTFGEATVASCVVFDQEGMRKDRYRRFNIKDIQKGDDYGALRQAITRRFTRIKEGGGELSDVVIIDGGKGQLKQAEEVLEELQIAGTTILSIAKGPGRKAGLEKIYRAGKKEPIDLNPDSLAMHLLQQIRDEAHRFAITSHKSQREKKRKTSRLQDIPGIGVKRRKQLLQFFGGLQQLEQASIDQIALVPGISRFLAKEIYDKLRNK
jgi:excinuclease ABC subunit C